MDLFVEHIVEKKRTSADNFKRLSCVLGGIASCFIIPGLLEGLVGVFAYAICIAILFLLYHFMHNINTEYEYSFTNGALDVDKIIAAKRRKNLASLNAREIEIMASRRNSGFKKYLNDDKVKKIYACGSLEDKDLYFVIYFADNEKNMLIFNPNGQMIDGFRRLNPQRVFSD